MQKTYKINYKNKRIQDLTDKEFQECSELYSSNYGTYTSNSPHKPGQPIKMTVSYYKEHYYKKNYYIALAYKNRTLVGQALYVRKKINKKKFITWIIQLVVKKNARGNGIAKKLMQSIWGFSNDYAWGLATPNIYTIKTLESTTFRKCNPKIIKKHLYQIKKIAKDIDFIDTENFIVDADKSIVNTNFYVNRNLDIHNDYSDNWIMGELPEGHEWLAFTFNQQKIDIKKYKERAKELIEFSEENLKDAYSRMHLTKHNWAKGHTAEVDYIINTTQMDSNSLILDFGCGIARHSIEFARRGYSVVSIDFSEKHIKAARRTRKKLDLKNLKLYHSDIRTFSSIKSFDTILCLYDVIGSFPNPTDNIKIIKNANKLLKDNGYFILSVMNYELTDKIVPAKQKANLLEQPEILMKLSPSIDMMETGDIFNPDHLAIDTKTKLVYRKEQFPATKTNYLPAEYIIRDKRYTMDEITSLVVQEGFKVIDSRYVQAGKFSKALTNTDPSAKEILLICQKCD